MTEFMITDGTDKTFIKLCHMLDESLNEIVGGEEKRAGFIPLNALDNIHDAIIAYMDGEPVGCASFKCFDKTTAEMKRVFIKKEFRGKGLSKPLIFRLEAMAKARGYQSMILETGDMLKAAMHVYEEIGYKRIPNYGPYKDMADSVCMKKIL